MEQSIERCEAGEARYMDSDGFDTTAIEVIPADGWVRVGDTGWVNDYGWNDVPWEALGFAPELAGETCIDETNCRRSCLTSGS